MALPAHVIQKIGGDGGPFAEGPLMGGHDFSAIVIDVVEALVRRLEEGNPAAVPGGVVAEAPGGFAGFVDGTCRPGGLAAASGAKQHQAGDTGKKARKSRRPHPALPETRSAAA